MKGYASLEIEVSESEVQRMFRDRLDGLCGGEHTFVEDGKVMNWEDTHGSGYTHEVENPTDVQINAIKLRETLREAERRKTVKEIHES